MLKLGEGFPDAILNENHRLAVRPTLDCGVQYLADSGVEQRDGGGAVDVAGGQSRDERRTVHMERACTEDTIEQTVEPSK